MRPCGINRPLVIITQSARRGTSEAQLFVEHTGRNVDDDDGDDGDKYDGDEAIVLHGLTHNGTVRASL